jgi:hypothetical protein
MSNASVIDTLNSPSRSSLSPLEAEVLRHLRSLRYGQLTVQVHDARVVQIERTEKIRPDPRSP